MNGYVNGDRTGWTELRVHGVSGTPPESLLQHPQVLRVAGDANAGFYRRRYDSGFVSADSSTQRDEAYFWGGLTAGGAQNMDDGRVAVVHALELTELLSGDHIGLPPMKM